MTAVLLYLTVGSVTAAFVLGFIAGRWDLDPSTADTVSWWSVPLTVIGWPWLFAIIAAGFVRTHRRHTKETGTRG